MAVQGAVSSVLHQVREESYLPGDFVKSSPLFWDIGFLWADKLLYCSIVARFVLAQHFLGNVPTDLSPSHNS